MLAFKGSEDVATEMTTLKLHFGDPNVV